MSPVDARNDIEKISSACLCKDDTAQINSCDTAQTVAQEATGEKKGSGGLSATAIVESFGRCPVQNIKKSRRIELLRF